MSIISKNNASKLHEDSVKPLSRKKAYVNKIVASVAAILIAFTPNLGALKVDELLSMSEDQLSTTLHTTDRATLLPLLPMLWLNFWESYDAAKAAALYAALYVAFYAACDAACDAAGNAVWYAACDAVRYAACGVDAWNETFANAWRQGGAAYNIIMRDPEKYNDDYFRNLVEVLVRQTKRLQQSVQQN